MDADVSPLEHFRKGQRINLSSLFGKNANSYVMESGKLAMNGDFDGALQSVDTGLLKWPDHIVLLETKASVLSTKACFIVHPRSGFKCLIGSDLAIKLADQAFELYNRVLELEPKRGASYMCRSNLRFMLGDREGALVDIKKAVQFLDTQDIQAAPARQMLRELETGLV